MKMYSILNVTMDKPSKDIIALIIGVDIDSNTLCRYNLPEAYYFLNILACLNKHWNSAMERYRYRNHIYKDKDKDKDKDKQNTMLKYWTKWNWNIYKKKNTLHFT